MPLVQYTDAASQVSVATFFHGDFLLPCRRRPRAVRCVLSAILILYACPYHPVSVPLLSLSSFDFFSSDFSQVVPHITDALQEWIMDVSKKPVDGSDEQVQQLHTGVLPRAQARFDLGERWLGGANKDFSCKLPCPLSLRRAVNM